MGVGRAGNFLGEPVSKFKGLVVQEFETIDGACFDDVLGEHLHLATIAVHAEPFRSTRCPSQVVTHLE